MSRSTRSRAGPSSGPRTLRGLELTDAPVAEQLRDSLVKNMARVVDVFHEWDVDKDGKISVEELGTVGDGLQEQLPTAHVAAAAELAGD